LALQPRTLPGSEKELVWTGLLVTTRRGVGTYHLRRGVEAGLTAEQFADEAFGDWLPDGAMMANYDDAIARARGPLSAKTAWLIVATCHASHEQFDALAYDIRRFFGAGGIRAELAEALSYLLLHRGGPHLINSLNVWRDVAKEGRCEGPYDEAS
jgi:alkylhydroperoxidase/carboxymuconolactone decarboxylase family protein YurZ